MGGALLGGLLRSGWADVDGVTVVEPLAERRDELVAEFPGLHRCAAPKRARCATAVSGSPEPSWQ